MQKSILLVEDEPNVVSVIKRGLKDQGYNITVATDGLSGLQMALSYIFDLIILDVMLPSLDGVEICKGVRAQKPTVPILMLTALDSTINIVNALDSGADDYLTKPFEMLELSARIRTLLRRASGASVETSNIFRIADLEVNIEAKTVNRNEIPLNLTATEYRLLIYFVKNQKKVLSRIQILESVWDIDFNLGTNVVDVYVNYLRKKIESKSQQKLIHTVFGMGYVMKLNQE
jgi:DNA-binding response OmpR family regulator